MTHFAAQPIARSLKLIAAAFLLLVIGFQLSASAPEVSAADLFQQACSTGEVGNSPACQQNAQQKKTGENPISGSHGIIQEASNIFALVAVTAGLIIIVYSGFVFATAGGQRTGDNATRARQARTNIVSALGGIAIVALAWIIVTYVNTHIIHS